MTRTGRGAAAAEEADRRRVRDLVAMSEGDPLAPFVLRPEKSYVFAPDGRAAVGYRVRLRTAVVGGDPVGDPVAWASAVQAFVVEMRGRGLRVAVLGAGERARPLWAGYGLRAVAIGRDVVLRRDGFSTTGRAYRNLRQAIQRSHNAGVTVEAMRESEVPAADVRELRALMSATHREDRRGFSMILGRLFDGSQPDAVIMLARDRTGRIVGAHRYLWAGKQDLSLDLPVRARRAPNGVDERLVAEVVAWGREHGVERVSLAFAPFPDLFGHRATLRPAERLAYRAVHLLDPLIRVERLYTYLRKFHAFDQRRFVMLRPRQVVVVAAAALLLEFGR